MKSSSPTRWPRGESGREASISLRIFSEDVDEVTFAAAALGKAHDQWGIGIHKPHVETTNYGGVKLETGRPTTAEEQLRLLPVFSKHKIDTDVDFTQTAFTFPR